MAAEHKINRCDLLIGGKWVAAESGKRFKTSSPAHDFAVGDYAQAAQVDIDKAVGAARQAFDDGPWPHMSGGERAAILLHVAESIRKHRDALARLEVLESGKPITQALGEMDGTADLWAYASTLALHLHGDAFNTLGASKLGFTLREPIGVVGMITPWNFPLLIISQKLPFALAAGCTAVIKPSELTPGTTLALGQILQDAGMPDGVVNIVTGYGADAGSPIAEHPLVDMMSFTGSTAVGKHIVSASAGNLKKVSLELGGKNPQIVFPDADLDAALDAVVFGVYFNMGECCNSGSRLLVHKDIHKSFVKTVIERAKTVPVGDPLQPETKVGAIIDERQLEKIMTYIDTGNQEGGELCLGGSRMQTDNGRFIEPTVFDGVNPEMAIAKEEIFGPVLSVIPFATPEEAIHIANSTLYGLSAGVWTRNIDIALNASRKIRAGTIWVNCFMDGHPELPFGGYRESGLGRELGRFATEEFTELKTVQIHLGARTNWWHRP